MTAPRPAVDAPAPPAAAVPTAAPTTADPTSAASQATHAQTPDSPVSDQQAAAPGRALPAGLRLAPHRSVLYLGPTARVVGLDPDTALVADGLPPPLPVLLDRLDRPARTAELVAAAAAHGVPTDITRGLLARLVEAGALVDAAVAERAARARAGGVVSVRGRGPLAVGIVTGLLHGGIGTVHTDTGGAVRGADLGTGYCDA